MKNTDLNISEKNTKKKRPEIEISKTYSNTQGNPRFN